MSNGQVKFEDSTSFSNWYLLYLLSFWNPLYFREQIFKIVINILPLPAIKTFSGFSKYMLNLELFFIKTEVLRNILCCCILYLHFGIWTEGKEKKAIHLVMYTNVRLNYYHMLIQFHFLSLMLSIYWENLMLTLKVFIYKIMRNQLKVENHIEFKQKNVNPGNTF